MDFIEDEDLKKAVGALRRYCERNGGTYSYPSRDSYQEGDIIYLVNINGEMAQYDLKKRRLTTSHERTYKQRS